MNIKKGVLIKFIFPLKKQGIKNTFCIIPEFLFNSEVVCFTLWSVNLIEFFKLLASQNNFRIV